MKGFLRRRRKNPGREENFEEDRSFRPRQERPSRSFEIALKERVIQQILTDLELDASVSVKKTMR